jgi:hypothetical protein
LAHRSRIQVRRHRAHANAFDASLRKLVRTVEI